MKRRHQYFDRKKTNTNLTGNITLIILIFVMIILLLVPFYELFLNTNEPDDNSVAVATSNDLTQARVAAVDGKAWKITSGKSQVLEKDDYIIQGTLIRTHNNGTVELDLNGASLEISNNSVVRFDELSNSKIEIYQEKGRILANTLDGNYETFQVNAGVVAVESDAAEFAIERDFEVKVVVFKNEVGLTTGSSKVIVHENQLWMESQPIAVNIDRNILDKDFSIWKDRFEPSAPQNTPTPPPQDNIELAIVELDRSIGGLSASINLSGTKNSESSVSLNWNVNGSSDEGFMIHWAKAGGGNYSAYLSNPGSRSFEVGQLDPGQTYNFSVCVVSTGSCTSTSNAISISM